MFDKHSITLFIYHVKKVKRNTQDKYIVIECNVEMVKTNNRNA